MYLDCTIGLLFMREKKMVTLPVEGVDVEAAANVAGVVTIKHGRVAAWLPDGAILLLDGGFPVDQEISLRLRGVDRSVIDLFGAGQPAPADHLDIETHALVQSAGPSGGNPSASLCVAFLGRYRILGRTDHRSRRRI